VGTARLITGQAGQMAKQNFRLNTPVAAIGVRGTDFVVHADSDLTRVTVKQGAVVAAPYGEQCLVDALGPCSGVNAHDLAASLSGHYLEIQGGRSPRLITPQPGQGNLPFAPPRPEEPNAKVGNANANASSLTADMGGSSSVMWGRWAANATPPPGYELIGQNDRFVLYRAIEKIDLPQAGEINFRLAGGESYGKRGGGAYLPATVSNAKLSVNFDKMSYATQFDWAFDGTKRTFISNGSVNSEGRFVMDKTASNVSISGALSANGNEAGLVYFKRLEDQKTNAYGVLNWRR